MAVLYSQGSRNIVYQHSKYWDKRIQLFKLLKYVLKYKYLKSKNPEKDYEFFSAMNPERILKMLAKKNLNIYLNHSKMVMLLIYSFQSFTKFLG